MRKSVTGFAFIVFWCLVYVTFVYLSEPALQNYETRLTMRDLPTLYNDTTPFPPSTETLGSNSINQSTSTKTVPVVRCFNGSVGPIITASAAGGRLGNQMYMYATLYATLLKEGQRSGFATPEMYSHFSKKFHISLPILTSETLDKVKWTNYNVDQNYPRELSFSNEAPCLKLCCFPQQWELFHSFRPSILQEFKFQDHIVAKSNQTLSTARQKFLNGSSKINATLIGVHVRRTDYFVHSKLLKLYLPEIPFYRGALKYMTGKYENPVFVLASDDIEYCKKEFRVLESDYKIYYSEGSGNADENIGVDMATLANCDHLIFGVGTFGFWAGYLCGGEVVYCSCAQNDSNFKNDTKFFLPSWTGINANGELRLR